MNPSRWHTRGMLAFALLLGALPAHPQATQQAPVGDGAEAQRAPDAGPGLTAYELLVLQVDRYGDTANSPRQVQTSLFTPIPHRGRPRKEREQGGYSNAPMPLGLITFEGKVDRPLRVRLDLPEGRGFFHAHWPEDALKGPHSIDWPSLSAAGDRQVTLPRGLGAHWLSPMRSADNRLWLQTRDPKLKERFLLYDVSLPFKPALAVRPAENGYRLENTSPQHSPPVTLLLQRHAGGWGAAAFTGPLGTATAGAAALSEDPTPTVKPKLRPLVEHLAALGYSEQSINAAVGMVAQAGIDRAGMSLAYVLPEGEIDRHLRLRFRPEPQRVIRTAIVVVNNVDPDLGSRLDRLVAGLGDDDWAVRDRSQRELESIGLAAIRKVQGLKDHADPEVAFRARQILDAYDLEQAAGP